MKEGFIKKAARELSESLKVIYFAMKHPRTPWYAKFLGALVVLYALSPIDLIPDFIPVIGFLDDLIIVPVGLYLVLLMIPKDVIAEIKQKVSKTPLKLEPHPFGGVLIVSIWLILLMLLINWMFW
ncbi:MAG: hypothetical protein A2231_10345 [Candidatus Firestonebacteria bacterium RIFOXYA2_FULL_40_8]|nr:MAG: hypothetical protein A2231_10345 [Candidatus Firestonebacteria bacterium RIFOXYA2_FULL_40_8]